MKRRTRLLLAGVGGLLLMAGGVAGVPRLLPELPGFEVHRVEVVGASLLAAEEVVRGAGIAAGQSIWEDADAWEQALEGHAVVEDATVGRRLPGTLRVELREKRPVALVSGEVLLPVTATGERLPVDLTRSAPDLPIARGIPGGDEVPVGLLSEVERLARIDPELMAEVSEVEARDSVGGTLLLRHREGEIMLPAGITADRLVELRAVLADVEAKTVKEVALRPHLDLRYADQIVVRLPSSVQKP